MADGPNGVLITCKYCLIDKVKTCLMCKSFFCSIHANNFSPNFCKDCLTNLSVVMSKFNKTTSEYDPVTDTIEKVSSGCERIQLDGPDWIFYSEWIQNLNDEDMKVIYEFHYFVLKLIEHDNETRIVKRKNKLASTKMPLSVVTTKTSTTKREAKPKDVQKELEKLGIPTDTIKTMLKTMGLEYRESA